MFLMPGFVNLHVHLGDENKAPQNEYVYKLYMAHGVTTIRGVELTAQPFALKEKERSATNAIVAPRIFNYQRPGAGLGQGRGRHAGEGARVGALVRGQRRRRHEARRLSAAHHGGAARRSEEARPRLDRAPRAARRGADGRAHRREDGPRHRDPFLRALRAAAARLPRAAVARADELQRRAVPLRPGRAPLEHDPSARQRRVEGVPAGASQARHDLRSDDDGVCGGPRRDAHAQRRLARQVHAAVADGFLHAEPREPRLVLLRLDAPGRDRLAQLLPGVVPPAQRLQEDGRPRHGQRRRGLHLQHLGLRLSSTRWSCCTKPASIRSK